MTPRRIVQTVLIALMACLSGVQAQNQARFQAQHGWDKPRLVTTGDHGEGVVLDAERGVVWLAGIEGIVRQPLQGSPSSLSIQQRGVRRMVGQSAASGTALVWTQINPLGTDALWGAWNGQSVRLEPEHPVLTYAASADDQGAVFAYATLESGQTVLHLREWNQPERVVYRTSLSLGALTLERTPSGFALLFAEGYRITRDRTNGVTEEKFDAVLLEVKPDGVKRRVLGPAVFQDRRQRFMLFRDVRDGERLIPVWSWETEAEQRAAIMTGVHNPRLAFLRDGQITPFAEGGRLLGQLGNDVLFTDGSSVYAATLDTQSEARAILLSPDTIDRASLGSDNGTRFAAWSTVSANDQTSVYVADTRHAYQPNLMDRIAVSFGWNPWYAPQTALVQIAFALALAFVSSVLCLPLLWLFSSAFRNGWMACLTVAWVVVFGVYMLFQRIAQSAPNGPFAPLFASPAWLALVYLGVGTALVLLARGRWRRLEPMVGGLVIVFLAVALLTFGRAGFLRLT